MRRDDLQLAAALAAPIVAALVAFVTVRSQVDAHLEDEEIHLSTREAIQLFPQRRTVEGDVARIDRRLDRIEAKIDRLLTGEHLGE